MGYDRVLVRMAWLLLLLPSVSVVMLDPFYKEHLLASSFLTFDEQRYIVLFLNKLSLPTFGFFLSQSSILTKYFSREMLFLNDTIILFFVALEESLRGTDKAWITLCSEDMSPY
jgi:hypothetical protein